VGLIKRLQRITSARLKAFLDTVDDPETAIPQLVTELEDKVHIIANAEAKALSAVKSVQRKLDEAGGKVMRLSRGAELALKQGDEKTARDALTAQIKAEKEIETQKPSLAMAENALKDAREARMQLASQLEELKVRKDEILSRSRAAAIQKKSHDIAEPARNLLDEVARAEGKLDEDESHLQVQREIHANAGSSLDDRLRKLERDTEVEDRMGNIGKKE